jgi:hypothetical protein
MRSFLLVFASLVITLALAGCTTRRDRTDGGVIRVDGSPGGDARPGTDGGPPTGCTVSTECPTGQICVDRVCVPIATGDGGPPVKDAGPVAPGSCSPSCLSAPGAVCCQACGCSGSPRCDPVCPAPFMWDCELTCCFNYTTFECLAVDI